MKLIRLLSLVPAAVLAACGGDSPGAPTETVTTPVTTTAGPCTAASALTLSAGAVQILSAAEQASVCVAGGAGSEYALIPVLTRATPTTTLGLTVTGTNTSAITASLSSAPVAASGFGLAAGGASFSRSSAVDARLRMSERSLFTARATGARALFDARRTSGARLSVAAAAPQVGDLMQLNANSNDPCTSPAYRTGRVAAVTANAIVVADTSNPAGGFTDAEYKAMGVAFDTLVVPVDTLNFGAPGDIDGNGRAIIFYTKAVNDMTPANSQSYVGGFFYGRDLYPKTATSGFAACAGSNVGELFYMMVPDPTRAAGSSNSPFTKANVASGSIGVLAHEFQHLINESRRLYVTRTDADEETWLNEGLSHVAEELTYFRASGMTPGHNAGIAALRAGGAKVIDAYNDYEIANAGRLLEYLGAPETSSPIADNDDLSTRGATWQLLRYAADRKGGSESTIWRALVNSSTSGLANLQAVFGADAFGSTRSWIRDWAISNFADDAGVTVAAAYTQPSWNFRDLLPAITGSAYPVPTHAVADGTPVTFSLGGGAGAAYLRFRVASGTTATVKTVAASGTLPATLDMALVRTK